MVDVKVRHIRTRSWTNRHRSWTAGLSNPFPSSPARPAASLFFFPHFQILRAASSPTASPRRPTPPPGDGLLTGTLPPMTPPSWRSPPGRAAPSSRQPHLGDGLLLATHSSSSPAVSSPPEALPHHNGPLLLPAAPVGPLLAASPYSRRRRPSHGALPTVTPADAGAVFRRWLLPIRFVVRWRPHTEWSGRQPLCRTAAAAPTTSW